MNTAASTASASAGFDEFYAANFHSLTLQLCAYTGDLAYAQDLVQEAFCRALPRWSTIVLYDNPGAWVRRVAWNLAKNRFRQARRALAAFAHLRPQVTDGPTPDRVDLIRALATVPANARRVFILYYIGDLSIADIASQEQVAENTVKSWLHRTRKMLAEQLSDTWKEDDDARA
ncbi:sigma-70 family RNA polymerase sigma factor [Dactylosporangium sp. NPDC005572]|uniref:RNA polymerase sigma factor n=1 Tax=Dactylosporangium sp. NPDC005572 TaxID=3156889 RepID=UPI0033AA3384